MKLIAAAAIVAIACAPASEAARIRVRTNGRHETVVVHTGFPLHRTLPSVYVRPPAVAFRVAPVVYLPTVVFSGTTVRPMRGGGVWSQSAELDRNDGWTDFSLNVDQRGRQLLLDIDRAAQISFAEVVFENGDTQVVDFNDRVQNHGNFTLLDLREPRRIDHVRIVAKADRNNTRIGVKLIG